MDLRDLPALNATRSEERDGRHDADDGGEDGMAQQDGKINGPDGAFFLKADRADVEMIEEVRRQENGRHTERGEHYLLVRLALTLTDKSIADEEENERGRIQGSVQRR